MNKPVIIIGAGEMGGVFARGFLRNGRPVFPVTRDMDMAQAAAEMPAPELALVAVAENDLHPVLDKLPEQWRDCIGLLQNELLPRDWQSHQLSDPTVISVWFEKKKGKDYKVIIPSPVKGPSAGLIADSLGKIDIPCNTITTDEDMLYELVRKNVYILTTNIAGLITRGNVDDLWRNHNTLACDVATEVVKIQEHLTGSSLPLQRLIDGMVEAIQGDPDHMCMGRSAPARLQRALALAAEAGLEAPTLQDISAKSG